MENLKSYQVKGNNQSYYHMKMYNVPRKCPHCLHSISVVITDFHMQRYSSHIDLNYLMHQCPECTNKFLTMHLRDNNKNSIEFIYCYPSHLKHEHTEAIKKFFPRFTEIYDQAFVAEQMNHLTLAGAGYRVALEFLVKDYAILADPTAKEKILKGNGMTLNNCIQEFYKDIESLVPAHVVRKLGNDFAHYTQEFKEVDFKEIKTYLDIFVLNIEMKLKILDPPVPVTVSTSKK